MNETKEIRVFADRLAFPVLLFIHNEQQHELVTFLSEKVKLIHFRTEDICRWALAHGIDYHIYLSPLDRLLPWRRLRYHQIIKSLSPVHISIKRKENQI